MPLKEKKESAIVKIIGLQLAPIDGLKIENKEQVKKTLIPLARDIEERIEYGKGDIAGKLWVSDLVIDFLLGNLVDLQGLEVDLDNPTTRSKIVKKAGKISYLLWEITERNTI